MNLLIHHIKELVTVRTEGAPTLTGARMRDIGILHNASVIVRDGLIHWVGPSQDLPSTRRPGWPYRGLSMHTHISFSLGTGTKNSPCERLG
jgi:hypothetical protein